MNTLIDVEIDEISLVDEPANASSKILLFKRASALDRANAALEALKKALGATKPGTEGDTLPSTVEACDKAFKALVSRFKNDPIAALDSPEGRAIYQRRYEIANGLDRIEKSPEPEPAWKDEVAALETVKRADRYLAALVARETARTGKPRNKVYDAILRMPIGIAIYQRRSELARAA